MSMHTPGPWRAHYEDVLGPEGMTVAWCTTGFSHDPDTDGYSISEVEAHANARLIAASPDLLKALENLLGVMNDYDLGKYYFNPEISEALAIIAKAKGEPG